MDHKFNLEDLKSAFTKFGPMSPEFCECVDNFIKFLQFKYLGRYSEDLQQQCYVKIFESFDYYDSSRLNIASWVYTITRNQISGWIYRDKKFSSHSEDGLDEIGVDRDDSVLMDSDFSSSIVASFSRIVFIHGSKRVEERSLIQGTQFNKHFLWERHKTLLEV